MVPARDPSKDKSTERPLVWLHGEIKTPPFSPEARQEAGKLLRFLQRGENLSMPHAEPLSAVGARCGALRVRDANHNWRIMYRLDVDAVLVVAVYSKRTRKVPDEIVDQCKRRLRQYDAIARAAKKSP
jgi:phage-related protein